MVDRILVIICDIGSDARGLQLSLDCVRLQTRVPDRVIVGRRDDNHAKTGYIRDFRVESERVEGPWWCWLICLAGQNPGGRLAVMEAGQFWPVGRLEALAASDRDVAKGVCGYFREGLGGEMGTLSGRGHPLLPADEDLRFVRAASAALIKGSAFRRLRRWKVPAWLGRGRVRKWSRRVQEMEPAVDSRVAAGYWSRPAITGEAASMPQTLGLDAFRERHKGTRAFVIGNGPSLARMDLTPIADEITFASNGIFLLFERGPFRPQYYSCVDSVVLPDRARDIARMLDGNPAMTGFFPRQIPEHDIPGFSWWVPSLLGWRDRVCYYRSRPIDIDGNPGAAYPERPWEELCDGMTVTIVLLQLAALMGCNPIYLIGCDTEYHVPPSTIQLSEFAERRDRRLVSTGDDPNHFDPRYFGRGRVWHQPNPELMIRHYEIAKRHLEAGGVRVVNAGIGGKLEVFPRVRFEDIL